ncbi:hypothetical protein JCGZ_11023 [Jatropha curcas]|uniref:Uncharacterized protein n=1 Tax=Jatropha curcas TaxID=180498 RepID=A0A067KQX4_JATCU|nr:hypothetical protein JCGZ_11023 [Jatropha curcas]
MEILKPQKNPDLVMSRDDIDGRVPISTVACYGHRKMVRFLYAVTRYRMLGDDELIDLLFNLISNKIYGEGPPNQVEPHRCHNAPTMSA